MQSPASFRPKEDEYPPYFARYISQLGTGHIADILVAQSKRATERMNSIPDDCAEFRYEVGKWNVKELLGHVIDTERVMAFRALWFSREGGATLPSFDQDVWNAAAPNTHRLLSDIIEEYAAVRASTIALARSFDEGMWLRRGNIEGNSMTIRAVMNIIAGHEIHHLNILSERYNL